MKTPAAYALAVVASALVAGTAQAQTKPHTSGHVSFNAPQMRKHGSGLHRPNRPSFHHHYGLSGYRPVYPGIGDAEG